MTPERLKQVEDVYQAAMDIDPSQRNAYIDRICEGDEDLGREVKSLLSFETTFASVVDSSPDSLVAELLSERKDEISSLAGTQVGQYKILSLLGEGGMGAVFLARDTKLERRVAIKFLSDRLSKDSNRLERFFQEAKAASALNHPNIITVYEIGEAKGRPYIVSEFIDGKTLGEYAAEKRLALSVIIDIAIQVVSALKSAHQAGIIHRDIKPDNIMIREDGIAKVLDFGLAKLAEQRPNLVSEATNENDRTLISPSADVPPRIAPKTIPGMILGTPQYMSPEQARAQAIDFRTDIFSFGVVLYELISGVQPFIGVNSLDTIGSILKDEPKPLKELVKEIPPELDAMVQKCLKKERQQRFGSISELLAELHEVKREIDSSLLANSKTQVISGRSTLVTTQSIVTSRRFSVLHMAAILLVAAAAFFGVWWWFFYNAQPGGPVAMKTEEVVTWTSSPGEVYSVGSFSPDGKMVAFTSTKIGSRNIWIKQATSGEAVQVTKDDDKNDQPIWSPKGDELAYYSFRGGTSGIWRIPNLGGSPKLITELVDSSARILFWSENNRIYFEADNQIKSVDVNSGAAENLTSLEGDRSTRNWMSISRDLKSVAYAKRDGEKLEIQISGINGDSPRTIAASEAEVRNIEWHPNGKQLLYSELTNGVFQIFSVNVSGGTPRQLTFSEQNCLVLDVSADGERILYGSSKEESDVWAVDLRTGKESVAASDIHSELWADLSPDGKTLAYQSIKNLSQGDKLFSGNIYTKTLGEPAAAVEVVKNAGLPQWSPDGKSLSFVRFQGVTPQIYKFSPAGGKESAVTSSGVTPVSYSLLPYNRTQASDISWSPDGSRIAFDARRNGVSNIWLINQDGTNETQITPNESKELIHSAPLWSADGKTLAYTTRDKTPDDRFRYAINLMNVDEKSADPIYVGNSFIRLIGWKGPGELFAATLEGESAFAMPTAVSLVKIDAAKRTVVPLKQLKSAYLYNIHLSGDGKSIAFVSNRDEKDNVWLLSSSGGDEKQLTNNNDSRLYFSSLSWSRDGNSLFFGKQLRFSLLSMLTNQK
jgi:serine/threonine protein kinase/Tol biopolymer transport system component